jgi:lantibiotic modifying enzyme
VIQGIAATLHDPCRPLPSSAEIDPRRCRVWLSEGRAGSAIFHAYHARTGFVDRSSDTPWEHLDWTLQGVEDSALDTVGLWSGYAGLAWALRHIHRVLDAPFEHSTTEEIDAVLEEVARQPWTDPLDLTKGLVGLGVYALEWLPCPRAQALLATVIRHLGREAAREADGVTWRLRPEPDLGMAHGVAGVVAFLSLACASGAAPDRARALLEGAVPWLLRHRQDSTAHRRAAWCDGEPGVAAAFVLAGMATANAAWKREGAALAREIARRDLETMDLPDSGLCHGTAGTAHLLNRLWQWTGDESCREAASSWMLRLLQRRRPTGDEGLMTGSAGIGLALMAAVGEQEPEWDRLFLLSGPVRTANGHA